MARNMPADEVSLDPESVRALLRAQHPDLASLPLSPLANGWDCTLMRLGGDLLVRLPRREAASRLVANEQRWLPELAPTLPLPVPVPVRVGRAGAGYPWPWSITPYLTGEIAAQAPLDTQHAADALARLLARLHRPAPASAPANPFRGVALRHREERFRENLLLTGDVVDSPRVVSAWREALAAAPWPGAPVWLHGDLHPANVLVERARIAAVIDFGDITSGDPATDLAIAWMLLPRPDRRLFWSIYHQHAQHAGDPGLEQRTRGWALALGMAFIAHSADNPVMDRIGLRTVDEVLEPDHGRMT